MRNSHQRQAAAAKRRMSLQIDANNEVIGAKANTLIQNSHKAAPRALLTAMSRMHSAKKKKKKQEKKKKP